MDFVIVNKKRAKKLKELNDLLELTNSFNKLNQEIINLKSEIIKTNKIIEDYKNKILELEKENLKLKSKEKENNDLSKLLSQYFFGPTEENGGELLDGTTSEGT